MKNLAPRSNGGRSLWDTKARDRALSFFFLLPSVACTGLIIMYPLISGILYSLKDSTLFDDGSFVGLESFMRVLSMPAFWRAMRFSAEFSILGVAGSFAIGLLLALLLNNDIPARSFFRAALLIPWIVPSIVSVVAWRWLLGDTSGMANMILGWFHIKPILFLADRNWAVISVSVVKIWRSFPFIMISILAVLQTIPGEQYEAARIDGANRRQTFRFVTWPNLVPITIVCGILMTIWSVNDFDTIYLLTNGGPFEATQNVVVMAYKYAFVKNDISAGSAMAIITMVVLMILANIVMKVQRSQEGD